MIFNAAKLLLLTKVSKLMLHQSLEYAEFKVSRYVEINGNEIKNICFKCMKVKLNKICGLHISRLS